MAEFRSRWRDFTPTATPTLEDLRPHSLETDPTKPTKAPEPEKLPPPTPRNSPDKTDESPFVGLSGEKIGDSPTAPRGYVATARMLMERWHALARPVLMLPRPLARTVPGLRPYQVPSLAAWFLENLHPYRNEWAPRSTVELEQLAQVLTELEAEATP